ncbi:MAG: hypothetical protein C4519_08190 [Desulfobacteraceae bacterium]|nr:MAG: hypothetical protein C4519_08190 [Desulfobacteraceae bacterium]
MNPKKQILAFLKRKMNPAAEDHAKIREVMDGMGTGTARLIIEREADYPMDGDYTVGHLENTGRYYLGKIVRHDGTVAQRLIVDKQTGLTRFL